MLIFISFSVINFLVVGSLCVN